MNIDEINSDNQELLREAKEEMVAVIRVLKDSPEQNFRRSLEDIRKEADRKMMVLKRDIQARSTRLKNKRSKLSTVEYRAEEQLLMNKIKGRLEEITAEFYAEFELLNFLY